MTIYVDANAKHDGNGSRELPFRRIGQAARVAMPGDEVVVAIAVVEISINPHPEDREHRSAQDEHSGEDFRPGKTADLQRIPEQCAQEKRSN